jgi:hypothetical protein
MSAKDRVTLINQINSIITTNGNNEIDGAKLRAQLIDIVDSYANSISDNNIIGLKSYDSTKTYLVGTTCLFSGDLYLCNIITTGTFNPLHWSKQGSSQNSIPTGVNFGTPNAVSVNNGDTGLTLPSDPPANCRIDIFVNGELLETGDGTKSKNFYLSGDNGSTARPFSATTTGDKLFFNAVVTGWNLETTDKVSIHYNSLI